MKPISALAATILFILAISEPAKADEPDCPSFTHEQKWLLHMAYLMGEPVDWGYTLAAMTWQESFWGDEVRRINENDGEQGSFGVVHVLPETALHVWGWDQSPENIAIAANLLLTCDSCAMETGLSYLMRWEYRGWHGMIAKYNGRGERAQLHAERVIEKAHTLMECKPWRDY